ncbi:KAP family NTPase [Pseudomonas tensinigenes]|uniref:KAP family NTPase n=1 Tax=Pseudomonas tensinigenes TaxID=2745511 RepID=A0ABX8Q5Y6_9PSED|nr:P-loop NTPase fold protein [Pseudomonas tensinigenes]QXI08636.1 KAP family NTPase [Pseudomonas tensinigenes]
MKTSIQTAADALQSALSNPAYRVIALTGKWGTGKTYLWQTLKPKNKGVLEVSAFGARNIEDIKRKLFQDSIKVSNIEAKDFAVSAINVLEAIPKKFLGLSVGDAALAALPQMVKKKTIIIDDVERKNKSLEISEVLGLINEFTEKYNCRFLLILNTDSMEDKQIWQSLHEKVIDKEIALNPTSADSFKIAAGGLDTPIITIAKEVFAEYKIQNIRIIKKTLEAVIEILPKQNSLPESLYRAYIPTLIFLGICYFRGFSNGVTLDYAANHIFRQPNEPKNEEWDAMISKIAIRANKLSELAIDYFRLGVMAHEDVAIFFKPLKANIKNAEFQNRIDTFIKDLYWSLEQTETDVQSFLLILTKKIYRLDAGQISRFFDDLCLHGYKSEAEHLLSAWLEKAKSDPDAYKKLEYVYRERAPKRLWEFKAKLNPPEEKIVSLKEAVQSYLLTDQLTQKSINTLSSATKEEYESTLKSLTTAELKDFFELHFRLGERRENYWRSAQESFIAACKDISMTATETKLGIILGRELKLRKL